MTIQKTQYRIGNETETIFVAYQRVPGKMYPERTSANTFFGAIEALMKRLRIVSEKNKIARIIV